MKKLLIIALIFGNIALQGNNKPSPLEKFLENYLKANEELELTEKDIAEATSDLNYARIIAHKSINNYVKELLAPINKETKKKELESKPQELENIFFQTQLLSGRSETEVENLAKIYYSEPDSELSQLIKEQIKKIPAAIITELENARHTTLNTISKQLELYEKIESISNAELEISVALKINNKTVDEFKQPIIVTISQEILEEIKGLKSKKKTSLQDRLAKK